MRVLMIALAGLMASACNLVMSEAPMFGAADVRGARLREGVWVEVKADCAADAAAPLRDLAECADAVVIRNGQITDASDVKDEPIPYLLAAGQPPVMQLQVELKNKAGRPAKLYAYAAFKPVKTDPEGRIVEARRWPVQCGPPPPKPETPPDRAPKASDYTTRSPLPGLTVEPETGVCSPRDQAAVRGAAAASEAWDEDKAVIRWLRDVRPEDLEARAAPSPSS